MRDIRDRPRFAERFSLARTPFAAANDPEVIQLQIWRKPSFSQAPCVRVIVSAAAAAAENSLVVEFAPAHVQLAELVAEAVRLVPGVGVEHAVALKRTQCSASGRGS